MRHEKNSAILLTSGSALLAGCGGDGSGALELTPTTLTYLKAGCSGPVPATETMSATIGAVPDGVAGIVIKLRGSDAAASVRIDKLTLSIPACTFNVAGPGVEHVIHHDQQQWCTGHEGGSTCVDDDGMHKASTVAGGMVLSNNKLYTVVWNGSDYVPDTLHIRQ